MLPIILKLYISDKLINISLFVVLKINTYYYHHIYIGNLFNLHKIKFNRYFNYYIFNYRFLIVNTYLVFLIFHFFYILLDSFLNRRNKISLIS